jgi:hypothetical protein
MATLEEMLQSVRLDLAYMVDLMADYDFVITEEEAFEAWLWACYDGNDYITWDSPFNYPDDVIVGDIKSFYEEVYYYNIPDEVVSAVLANNPFVDEWVDAETAAYIPKDNAKVEGFRYDAD